MPTIMWNQRNSRLTHSPRKTSIPLSFTSARKGRSANDIRQVGLKRQAAKRPCPDASDPILPFQGRVWRASSIPRQLVVDALDVEVHTQDLAVVEMRAALALDRFAVLRQHRAFERMQRAGRDRRLR